MLSKVFTRQEQFVICLLAVALIVGAVAVWYDGPPSAQVEMSEVQEISKPKPLPVRKAVQPVSVKIAVDVAGEVILPGVYEFDKGARVIDAIKRAGGITGDADDSVLNRAAYLVDGTRLVMPKKGEDANLIPAYSASSPGPAQGAVQTAGTGRPININTASQAELETLKGIGPTYAKAIIEYRESRPFGSIEEIQDVKGIGPKKFAAIRDRLFVGGQ
ncbi:helix-hairpin-helix domain-containing protein [Candidatus Hydrogenedentota bacterium]